MKIAIAGLLMGVSLLVYGATSAPARPAGRMLEREEMARLLGGDPNCPDSISYSAACDLDGQNGNPPGKSSCGDAIKCSLTADALECRRITKYQYEKCKVQAGSGTNCSASTKGNGPCGEKVYGDKDAEGKCRESACTRDTIACGEVKVLTDLVFCQ